MKTILFMLPILLCACNSHPQPAEFSHFIMQDGKHLMDGDKVYRFISMNIPNLNYVEDEMAFTRDFPYRYPDEFEIRDAFETVRQMGGKVIRMYTLPVKRSDEPDTVPTFVTGPGEFVEEAFVVNDLMLKVANETGVRVIFSLLNNWQWMGGVPQYAEFRGKTFDDFWTDRQLIDDFKETIAFTINRTNTLTGVRYKDDKAIMCWETGNELMSPRSWVQEITAYIKSLDSNHLVLDGYYAVDDQRTVYEESVTDPNVDIVSSHHYEQDPLKQLENIRRNLDVTRGRKPYILGELGFESTGAHRRVYDYIISNDEITGTLNWSLRFHRREGGFYWHSEPVGHNLYKSYHWPGFQSGYPYDETGLLDLMYTKAFEIDGLTPPERPAPEAPTLLPIEKAYAISWQGSVGASGYNIERSESARGPWQQIAYNVSDASVQYFPLFNDETAKFGMTYFYRIEAINATGISPKSNVEGPVTVSEKALVDEMGNLMELYQAENVRFDTELDRQYKEDTERMVGEENSNVVYFVTGDIETANIYSFEQNQEAALHLELSTDGSVYQDAVYEIVGNRTGAGDYGYWDAVLYQLTELQENYHFLKIVYRDNAQIGRVEVVYKDSN